MCKFALLRNSVKRSLTQTCWISLFFFLNTNLKNSAGAEESYKVYSRTSGYTFLIVPSVDNQLSTQIYILQQVHETVLQKYCILKLKLFGQKASGLQNFRAELRWL